MNHASLATFIIAYIGVPKKIWREKSTPFTESIKNIKESSNKDQSYNLRERETPTLPSRRPGPHPPLTPNASKEPRAAGRPPEEREFDHVYLFGNKRLP